MNKGGIFLVEMPSSKGHEQSGFRPAIAISDSVKNTIILIPLTTKLNYSNSEYSLKITPSKENGLDLESIALVYQMRAIDVRRLKNKIGKVDKEILISIDNLIKQLLNLQ